jgi:hypothetical protein
MATDSKDGQPSIKSQHRREKRALRFLVLCTILTVTFFVFIHAVVYVGDRTGAAVRSLKKSEMMSTGKKAIIILP